MRLGCWFWVVGCWSGERPRKSNNQQPKTNNRSLATLALAALAPFASAQFDPTVLGAVEALRENGQLGTRPPGLNQPTGFPGLPQKRPDEEIAQQPLTISSDEGPEPDPDHPGNFVLRGNVEIVGRGYRLRADKAYGNRRTQVFTAEGNVYITGNGANVFGDKVTVDFINESYVAERAETQLPPDLLENRITDKLYVSGRLSAGTRLLTHTQDGLITTCNLERPHYGLEARDLEIRTGKRAIFRDAKFKLFGKTILQVPYLVVPLEDRSLRNLPLVGRTEDEGYFVKNTYTVPLKGNSYVVTHEDYMEKLGLGLGGDFVYETPTMSGVARLYKIFGTADTLTFSNDHRQAFRWGSINFQNDYQKDNYLTAPGQTLWNTRGGATYNGLFGDGAVTRLTLNRNSNSAAAYSSVSESLGLGDTRRIGSVRTDVQVNYLSTSSAYNGGNETETQRLQYKIQGTQEIGLGTVSLIQQRTVPIGETRGFVGSNDLTPVLSLSTDSRHLLGQEGGRDYPFRAEVSMGEYADARLATQTTRYAFSLQGSKNSPSDRRLTFDTNYNFRQGVYSDDTAQYVLGFNENIRYRLGSDTGINLRYGYLRPYGYSPLSIDSTGQTNFFSTDINVRPVRPVLLGLQTGYDLLREQRGEIAWQQVGIRSEWTPRSGILLRGLYTYDTYQQAFSQLRFDLSSYGRETRGNLNAQYDGIRHTWSTINGSIDGLRLGRTKISALFSYNGYLKTFETKQYAFTYDLHCAEAVLAIQENNFGFRPGRQVFLLLRIKALPFDVPFGTGTRGQGVGFGSGTNF